MAQMGCNIFFHQDKWIKYFQESGQAAWYVSYAFNIETAFERNPLWHAYGILCVVH